MLNCCTLSRCTEGSNPSVSAEQYQRLSGRPHGGSIGVGRNEAVSHSSPHTFFVPTPVCVVTEFFLTDFRASLGRLDALMSHWASRRLTPPVDHAGCAGVPERMDRQFVGIPPRDVSDRPPFSLTALGQKEQPRRWPAREPPLHALTSSSQCAACGSSCACSFSSSLVRNRLPAAVRNCFGAQRRVILAEVNGIAAVLE